MMCNHRLRGAGRAAALAVLVAVAATSASAQAPGKTGTVERVTVHSPALVGNLTGESPARDVFIYLPPGYRTNRNARYPVVYMLHGYGLTAERWMTPQISNMQAAADQAIAAGAMKEMIIVSPDGRTQHGGSMYSASVAIGDWETFIAEDLVAYVDKNYRTLAARESRGLGGHSMGGYGTLRIGMKRPDVFSSLYPMSSCCVIDATVASLGRGDGAARAAGPGRGAAAGRGGGFGNVAYGLAAAWAPNPNKPPLYFDEPIVNGEPQPLVIARYAANSPFAMLPQYVTNLKKYTAIKLDCGLQDGLLAQNRQLVESMTALGVPHVFETYEGDHSNRVPQRVEQHVLPFFSANLSFTAPKK
jgi:S-formylglutathione hydrolase FrmB